MTAYYNEHDPYAAQWLRNLIKDGLIADGEVDDRDIQDVRADDLRGFVQCHFFAGIGGWSLALRLAGWPDDRPTWTASVPCQPYSVASVGHGGAKGQGDERDLWPIFFPLARECEPAKLFGEQVASSIQWGWWDRAALDLEGEGYAAASAVLRADAIDADHERKRLYWVANTGRERRPRHQPVNGILVPTEATLAIYGDTIARARRALDGNYRDLLLSDGLSVVVERERTRCFGNAIHPAIAAEFIRAAA